MKMLYHDLGILKDNIEGDTWNYIEQQGAEPPKIKLSYKDIVVSIPLDLAETNQFIQETIDNLMDLIKDVYLED